MVQAAAREAVDQAAGLRRMFHRRPNQVVAFCSGRSSSGMTSLVIQTGLALSESGHRVLLIDEHEGPGSAISALGLKRSGDLWDSLVGKIALERSITYVQPNFWAVSGAGAASRLQQDSQVVREKLGMLMTPMQAGSDFILIDSLLEPRGQLSLLSSTAYHMVLVVSAETSSITESYALIKRLVRERGREGFQVVITRPGSDFEARQVFDNLKRTAGEHLGVRLDLLDIVRIPTAEGVADALCAKLPIPHEPVHV